MFASPSSSMAQRGGPRWVGAVDRRSEVVQFLIGQLHTLTLTSLGILCFLRSLLRAPRIDRVAGPAALPAVPFPVSVRQSSEHAGATVLLGRLARCELSPATDAQTAFRKAHVRFLEPFVRKRGLGLGSDAACRRR